MSDDYLKEMERMYQTTLRNNSGSKGGQSGIVCPNTTSKEGKVCNLCEICKNVLINRDTPRKDPTKEKARTINAKRKYYSNIILVSNPSEVIVLEYGEKIFNQLIAGQMDDLSEWKNFMHPRDGRNLYITKVKLGAEKQEVDYKVEPRMSVSALGDPSVLTRLYDISNIVALMESGKVKPTPQSKFDFTKTEVRFLPSGDKTKPLLFFKLVMWHYNISKEEFDAVQRGTYNPITGLYTVKDTPMSDTRPSSTSTSKQLEAEDLMAEWGLDDDTTPAEVPESSIANDDEEFETSEDVEPMCYGQYDGTNKTCIGTCTKDGWAESCKKIYEEKLALRKRAKRVTK